jgi:hypothetical protein
VTGPECRDFSGRIPAGYDGRLLVATALLAKLPLSIAIKHRGGSCFTHQYGPFLPNVAGFPESPPTCPITGQSGPKLSGRRVCEYGL